MEIRTATKNDLFWIQELGKTFGHLMLYQRNMNLMEKYLPRILVAEELDVIIESDQPGESHPRVVGREVVGYYHYIVSGDPGFREMLRCYRQFPTQLEVDACCPEPECYPPGKLCVCMQGASHREVFREFIKYLQGIYPEIWCYCSIKSQRPETYKELGFTFDPYEQYTFFNCNKGDYSTYRLGRWIE